MSHVLPYSSALFGIHPKISRPPLQRYAVFSGVRFEQNGIVNDTYQHVKKTLEDYASLSDLLTAFNPSFYTLKIGQGEGHQSAVLTLCAYNQDALPSGNINFGVRNINRDVAPLVKSYLVSALQELDKSMPHDFSGILDALES